MSKPDKISQVAMAARASGTSYGKLMAMRNPVTVNIPMREPGEGEARCKSCGVIFKKTKFFRVVCSPACRDKHYKDSNRENMRSKRGR